jgi:nucleoside-diphosphate-sugar epimerase
MSRKRHTILGAKGFIGGRLLSALQAADADCFAPGRDDPRIFTEKLGNVFYCIGLTADFSERPFDTVEAHVSLFSRFLEYASFDRLVYLSSTRLYDSQHGGRSGEDTPLTLSPANPRHLYDLSKALGENLCLTQSGGRGSVARLSSVYDSAPDAPGFLSGILARLRHEREFTIDSASGLVRDYISIEDVIASLLAISGAAEQGIYNVASGENISNRQIADTLNAAGCAISLREDTPREERPVCDISRIEALGIRPVPALSYIETFAKGLAPHAAR